MMMPAKPKRKQNMDSTGSTAELVVDTEQVVPRPLASRFRLASSLDLTEADALCHALRHRLLESAILLDGSQVERTSTACLQVIAAAAAAARQRGTNFSLHDPSPILSAAIADLGLSAAIPQED